MTSHFTSAVDVRHHLDDLLAERALAGAEGLMDNDAYRTDLETEIAAVRSAYVGAAVTELATFRGQLFGRNQG